MKEIFDILSQHFSLVSSVILLVLLIWGVYNRIKFLCLQKASKMVADAESHSELSGKEKFALCLLWIDNELPRVFKSSLFKSIKERLLQFAYDTSYDYAEKYIKRKTGFDLDEMMNEIKKISEEKQ